jgi:hypothetical protein
MRIRDLAERGAPTTLAAGSIWRRALSLPEFLFDQVLFRQLSNRRLRQDIPNFEFGDQGEV